jgi:3-hydroxyacyl-[acyl-carrier-protein] dehydratase
MAQNSKLYDILETDEHSILLKMNENHPVYQGHFPGNPITPGVLTLRMIRECVSRDIHRPLHYSAIKTCRYVALIRPGDSLRLHRQITNNGDSLSIKATLSHADNPDDIRLQLDAEMR